MNYIQKLPTELIPEIVKFLDVKDYRQFSRTCHLYKKICFDTFTIKKAFTHEIESQNLLKDRIQMALNSYVENDKLFRN